jgi:type I restriction enzyme S subunit
VLKLGAVTYGTFDQEQNKAFLGDPESMKKNEVRAGDLLFARKNTRELVGATALVDEVRPHLLLPDLIFRLHTDGTKISKAYLQALLMNPRKRSLVRDLSSGSAASMPNISKTRLAALPVELPPLRLQETFEWRVRRVLRVHGAMTDSSSSESELFASLQDRAFSGRL